MELITYRWHRQLLAIRLWCLCQMYLHRAMPGVPLQVLEAPRKETEQSLWVFRFATSSSSRQQPVISKTSDSPQAFSRRSLSIASRAPSRSSFVTVSISCAVDRRWKDDTLCTRCAGKCCWNELTLEAEQTRTARGTWSFIVCVQWDRLDACQCLSKSLIPSWLQDIMNWSKLFLPGDQKWKDKFASFEKHVREVDCCDLNVWKQLAKKYPEP